MSKRPITSFFAPVSKKTKKESEISLASSEPPSTHPSYPHPIACLPTTLHFSSSSRDGDKDGKLGKEETAPIKLNNKPDLDVLHYRPFLHKDLAKELFLFLRRELPFYRVEYSITRGGVETSVKTPRYTSLFGVDESSYFREHSGDLLDTASHQPVPKDRYACVPRPIPQCLEKLQKYTETRTGCSYNFILINYYADTNDSISYHSDDEHFLGENPSIASLSLGATRDFLMKHKSNTTATRVSLPLASGDCLLMRNRTQSCWLHSIPKRSTTSSTALWSGGGRINITFRKALIRGGTENYYRYNIGRGPVWRWEEETGKMVLWKPAEKERKQDFLELEAKDGEKKEEPTD